MTSRAVALGFCLAAVLVAIPAVRAASPVRARVTPNQLVVTLEADRRNDHLYVSARNLGKRPLTRVVIEIEAPAGVIVAPTGARRPRLGPEETVTLQARACSTRGGLFGIIAKASGRIDQERLTARSAVVVASLRPSNRCS